MSIRRHRPMVSLAAVAVLGLTLTGCASDQEETQAALRSAEERISQAEERIRELEDKSDRLIDFESLRDQAAGALTDLDAASQDAAGRAEEMLGDLPWLDDVVDVESVKEQGRVIVDYADDALSADPAELERQLREAAEKMKDSVPDLRDVEFRVGDQTFTF